MRHSYAGVNANTANVQTLEGTDGRRATALNLGDENTVFVEGNPKARFSKEVDFNEDDMERLENIRKADSHIRYMNDVFDATATAVTGKSTQTGSVQRKNECTFFQSIRRYLRHI